MQRNTYALMLEFFKPIQLSDGVGGTIPIKIIIPNVPNEERRKNQAYRICYWYLKTKFEAVETGLIEFAQEFMSHIALGEHGNVWSAFKQGLLPKIESGEMPSIKL